MKNMIELISNSEADNERLSQIFIPKPKVLDSVDFSKVIVKKPWGHEYLLYDDGNASAWVLHINKDNLTSMHCHIYKKTALIVLAGKVACSTLNHGFLLNEGDGLILDKKVFHSTQALSQEEVILLELETPSKKTDVVRLIDIYGRQSEGYESESEMIKDMPAYKRVFFNVEELGIEKRIGNKNLSFNILEEDIYLDEKLLNSELLIILGGELKDEINRKSYIKGDIIKTDKDSSIMVKRKAKILKISVINSERIKAILFDFDGVIGKTMEDNFIAWKRAFLDFGVEINEDGYFPLEGAQLNKVAEIISNKYAIKNIDYDEIIRKKENYYKENNSFSFYEGVLEFISLLKEKGIKIAIVSAARKERLFSTVPQDFLMKFDSLITGDMIQNGKPSPEPYLKAISELNLKSEECIVIENAPFGIEAAKSAGTYCIAISSTMDKSYLSGADVIVNNFHELNNVEKIKEIIEK
ncbi:MAG: HAD family phosphatase [Nanoarchaeota archaeon]